MVLLVLVNPIIVRAMNDVCGRFENYLKFDDNAVQMFECESCLQSIIRSRE